MRPRHQAIALAFAIGSVVQPATARADTIEFAKIAGKWCTKAGSYVFTPSKLAVTFANGNPQVTLVIEKIIPQEDRIEFVWANGRGNTAFIDFSKDGKSMAQEPNTKGDMGPRREFKRC